MILGSSREWHVEKYQEERMRDFGWLSRPDQLLAVRGGMGLGKTYQTRKILHTRCAEPEFRCLLLGPRITFDYVLKSIASDLPKPGFSFYQQLPLVRLETLPDGRTVSSWARHPRLILQYESLHRLAAEEIPKYDLVILDEIESILECVCAGFQEPERTWENSKVFARILKQARQVIALDADLEESSIALLETLMNESRLVEVCWHENTYINLRRNVELISKMDDFWSCAYTSAVQVLTPAIEQIFASEWLREQAHVRWMREHHGFVIDGQQSGFLEKSRIGWSTPRKVAFLSGSKKMALEFQSVCLRIVQGLCENHQQQQDNPLDHRHVASLLIRCYHSESDDLLLQHDIACPNDRWASGAIIIFTSRLTVGADYTNDDVRSIHLYGSPFATSPRELLQMSGRFRSQRDDVRMCVHIAGKTEFSASSPNAFETRPTLLPSDESASAMEINCQVAPRWLLALGQVCRTRRLRATTDFLGEFIRLAQRKGYRIDDHFEGTTLDSADVVEGARESVRNSLLKRFRKMPIPSVFELAYMQALKMRGCASSDQKLALLKADLKTRFPLASDEQLFTLCSNPWTLQRLFNLQHLSKLTLVQFRHASLEQLVATFDNTLSFTFTNWSPLSTWLVTKTPAFQLGVCVQVFRELGLENINQLEKYQVDSVTLLAQIPQWTIGLGNMLHTIAGTNVSNNNETNQSCADPNFLQQVVGHQRLKLINDVLDQTLGAFFMPMRGIPGTPLSLRWKRLPGTSNKHSIYTYFQSLVTCTS